MSRAHWIPDNFRQILPGLGPWIDGRATDPLATRLQDFFAPLEVVHFLGLFTLSSAVILIGLRLLGVGLVEAPASVTARTLRPWLNLGLALALTSGVLMGLTSTADKLYKNEAFLWKMIALVAAVVISYGALTPIARDEGRLGRGALAALVVGLAVWLFALLVMLGHKGANVGAFHLICAAALIAFVGLRGRWRLALTAGVISSALVLQMVTHAVITDPYSEPYMTVNKAFMWATGLFVLALAGVNIAGRSAAPDTTIAARLAGYAAILTWVSVGAGGRWIGFT
jgi:hypothetical protein